ncbi:hypothetical protein ATZ33_14705 [Enterococcus silesiacus]|uniref:LPXTG-domain-containing protein cell wall anchor domain n=1 Tax=Enterococcus silesiacus TaxID=332949 RepID=A0A0S3KEB8_9ENTE|nr:LPXTG cell wall anchor domain-containing protein [Enterococcus silesiacus]ALS02581.1 hypothetical protein ATZ33_14705 [Enterococcus silesiacus]OJG93497.1 LPXTG-domain-containing protein cell wall anchor domain [Enterococcus silesiacus]
MKINNHVRHAFSFIAVLFLLLGVPKLAHAAENGGAIQTNGQITFFESEPSSSSSTEPTTSTSSSSSSTATTTSDQTFLPGKPTKPVGRYPSTGELVGKSLSVTGLALLLILLVLYLWKRKKHAEQKRRN